MPKLLGPGAANGVEIPFGGLIVGRERGCDIVLRSKNVSRNHARLTIQDKIPRVEDLGSSNGTKVNGVPIKGITELHTGDSITFGDMTLQLVEELRLDAESGPTVPAPSVNPNLHDFDTALPLSNSRHETRWSGNQSSALLNVRQSPSEKEIDVVGQTQLMRRPTQRERIVESPVRPPDETGIPRKINDQAKSKSKSAAPVQRRTFALEACAILLGLNLLVGFFAGRVAQRMGAIQLPGELSTRQNLVAPISTQALTSIPVDQPTLSDTPQSAGLSDQQMRNNGSGTKPTNDGSGSVNQKTMEASTLDRAEVQEAPTSSNAMSTTDSAKALRLMREVERAGVDLGDTEAVLKIANQKLGTTPDQTRRVVKFVKLLADRKALIEGGGLNFNLDPKPKTKSTTLNSTPASATSTDPTSVNSTPQPDASQNVAEPKVSLKPPVVTDHRGVVHQSDANEGATITETEVKAAPTFIMSVNRGAGYYINFWGLMLILGLAFAWQQCVYWMGADCGQSGMENEIWPLVACVAGPVGTLSALCCPDLGIGVLLNSACVAIPFLGYVAFRDERVPQEDRVLQFLSWFASGNEDETNRHRNQEELTNLAELGFDRKLQGELRDILAQPQGLLLVCGPSGSGKSTTLRCALSELDPDVVKIITIEDPIEYRIAGVTQIEIDSMGTQSYYKSLQKMLRKDPDVLMVGEIRDGETAIAVCQAATSEHMILSTVPANDTRAAIQCLFDLGVDRDSLANGLTAVLDQRIIRRLCVKCKEQYTPDTELLRRYRIPRDHESTFYRRAGRDVKCEACGGTGYRGRVGIFELLRIDDTVRTLIRERASPSQIRSAARSRGMTTLRENGFRMVIRGVTSLDEVEEATRH